MTVPDAPTTVSLLDPTLFAALIGAGSAIIGGAMTAAVQYWTERGKRKTTVTTRWDAQLLHLSVELLKHCEMIAPRNTFAGNNVEEARRTAVDYRGEHTAIRSVLTRIELLGPESLYQRAKNLHYACDACFAQPIDEKRTGHDHVYYDLRDAYDSYIAELKVVLSARKSGFLDRKVESLSAKRGPVIIDVKRQDPPSTPDAS